MRAALLLVALVGAARAADLRAGVPGVIRRVDDERAVGEADFLEFEEELKNMGHYEFLQVGEGADPNQAQPQDLAPRNMECYCKFVKQKVEVAPASAYNNMDPSQGKSEGKAEGFKETGAQLASQDASAPGQEGTEAAPPAAEPRFAAKGAQMESEREPREEAALEEEEEEAVDAPSRRQRVVRRRPALEEEEAAAEAAPRFSERRASLYTTNEEDKYADRVGEEEEEEDEMPRVPLRRRRARRSSADLDPYTTAPESDLLEESEEGVPTDEVEREIEEEEEEERRYRRMLLRQRRAHRIRLAHLRQRLERRAGGDL